MTASDDKSDRATQPVDAERSQPSFPSQSSAGDETNKSLAGSAGSAAGLKAAAGQRIRDYDLLELLGQGGMGSVWKAKHTRLKKFVAVKLLPQEKTSDVAAVARFNREMEAVGQLRHPHIIEAHDAGEEAGTHYLVMEYVAGIELAELSKKVGPFPIADACELMRQTALGLQHAFEHGLVHRDIKPSNLMLAWEPVSASRVSSESSRALREEGVSGRGGDGERAAVSPPLPIAPSPPLSINPTLKILDLGLALLLGDQPGAELTSTGQVMGTLDYIAPEQLADTHAVDIRADLYSLGCTLFRLLTTEPPFAGPSLNTAAKKMFAHSFTPAPKLLDRRPDVPAELSALVARLLEKQPAARFATPREVATALAPFCVGHNLPALLASSSSAPTPSDPFASTVVPQQRAQASGAASAPLVLSGDRDHRRADAAPLANSCTDSPSEESRAPEPLTVGHVSSVPVTEHVENVRARRGSPDPAAPADRRSPTNDDSTNTKGDLRSSSSAGSGDPRTAHRPLLIVGAILAIVLLSVFLPPFLKRDASLTETANQHDAPNSKSEISNRKSQISNSKSQIPADPDRAAAEWALSFGGRDDSIGILDAHGAEHVVKPGSKIPTSPFEVFGINVHNERIDDVEVKRFLPSLKRLRIVHFTLCPKLTDAACETFAGLPALIGLQVEYSGMTDRGVLEVARRRPLTNLGISADKFTPALANFLATSTVRGVHLYDGGNDAHLRLLQRATNLESLVFAGSSARHATWANLPDRLPNLAAMYLTGSNLVDADLAAFCRLPKLEVLAVPENREVSDTGLEQLAAAPKLKFLDVNHTAVTPLGLADFLESNPACQVVWDGADHRAVAEWVLSVGGKVQVAGCGAEWLDASARRGSPDPAAPADRRSPTSDESAKTKGDLRSNAGAGSGDPRTAPFGAGPVLLTGVDLSGLATLKDADLVRLADCTTLRDL